MAKADIAAFSSMTQSSFTVYKIIDQVREINPDTYIIDPNILNFTLVSDKEKTYILDNTIVKSQVIDPVRGNDIFCTGKVAEDLR